MFRTNSAKCLVRLLLAAALLGSCAASFGAEEPSYILNVVFDLPRSRIVGTATIDLPPGAERKLDPGELRILSLKNASLRSVRDAEGAQSFVLHAEGKVEIRFEGTFTDQNGDVIDQDRIALGETWYPVVEGTYRYRLSAELPRDFVAVSEADEVRSRESNERIALTFEFPYPRQDWEGVTFVASRRWVSRHARYKDVELSVYVEPRNTQRLDEMIEEAQGYLARLEARLGAYPFKRLAVVENPVPLGYSLSRATYVLLTPRSVASVGSASPEDNSLNHEIAHQWFGIAVLADYEGGNWSEGLATYFSDHLENELLGRAWERRQRMMAAYQNNAAGREVLPLSGFTEYNDHISKLTGYAKSAIVFHMLRRLIGDERFFGAVRAFVADNRFRVASWMDLRRAFERAAARDLGWFFDQWVNEGATPKLGLDGASAARVNGKYELRLTVTQTKPAFQLAVPVAVYLEGGASERTVLQISGERGDFQLLLDNRPLQVVLDEDYDVFRRLTPAEMPPTIDNLLTRPRVVLAASSDEEKKFADFIGELASEETRSAWYGRGHDRERKSARLPFAAQGQEQGASSADWRIRVLRDTDIGASADTNVPSLILLGKDNPLIARLFGRLDLPRGGFTVTVLKHPRSAENVVAILTANSKAEVDAAYRELIDHPRYSSAAFEAGKLISRELLRGQRGISSDIAPEHR